MVNVFLLYISDAQYSTFVSFQKVIAAGGKSFVLQSRLAGDNRAQLPIGLRHALCTLFFEQFCFDLAFKTPFSEGSL